MSRERISVWRTAWFAPLLSLAIVITGSYFVMRDGSEYRRQHDARVASGQAATQQHIERLERLEQLVREGARDEFLNAIAPQDAVLWGALLPYAELDRDCNALPECVDDSMGSSRPITVQARGEYGDVVHIAILGIETWTPHGHGIIPRITYYVGSQGGALLRAGAGETPVEARDPRSGAWIEVDPESAGRMRASMRTAFYREVQRQFTTSHGL